MRRLVAPQLDLGVDKVTAFEKAFASATRGRGGIEYQLPYPKHDFLRYLVAKRDIVLHGSGSGAIEVFEPTPQTDYFGRVRNAVFAASDGIWPMFFAILDRSRYHGSLRNVCYWDLDAKGNRQKFYAFSINATFLGRQPWREGSVYVLPRATFERVVDEDGSPSEEWLSTREVTPLARLAVSPSDFPFLNDVETLGSTAEDFVTYYSQALQGSFFQHGETLQELRRILTLCDFIYLIPVPLGVSAYAKSGNADIAGFHARSFAGGMFFADRWAYFAFILNWYAPEGDDPQTVEKFFAAIHEALTRVRDALS